MEAKANKQKKNKKKKPKRENLNKTSRHLVNFAMKLQRSSRFTFRIPGSVSFVLLLLFVSTFAADRSFSLAADDEAVGDINEQFSGLHSDRLRPIIRSKREVQQQDKGK